MHLLRATRFINVLEIGYQNKSETGSPRGRAAERAQACRSRWALTQEKRNMKYMHILAISTALYAASTAMAHSDQAHSELRKFDTSKVEATPFGHQGDPKKVTRTLRVNMNDKMRFEPEQIQVRKGETIRFVVANHGAVLHEMVLGTAQALKEHAELMKKHPGMEHDEPSMTHVKPGAKGEIVWQFTQAGEFQFACLIPGHFEAGMVGKVIVK
jgi:uncharacterized cupredoxin-like copper-binding protein